jgi:leucyl-tRNA synthetase
LIEAKAEAYTKGFYKGIMKVGQFTGQKVEEAKKQVKQLLVETNQGSVYYEPEDKCVSRLGEECVVALCNQWYIAYGMEEQRKLL